MTDRELQYRLIYSIVVAGKSAKFAENVLVKLFGAYPEEPFVLIKRWIEIDALETNLRQARTGNYNKLIRALSELVKTPIDLRTCEPEDLERIHGIGPKSSRFFIMWTRPNVNYAALDTHVLKWLKLRGHNVPKSTPSGKKYKEIEKIFLLEAEKMGVSPQELDAAIWKAFSGYMNWSPEKEQSESYLA